MSNDAGVYILQTSGPEFRVAYCQGVDNIYSTFITESLSWLPDMQAIVEMFGKSPVYTDLEEAWDAAYIVESDTGYNEYGICLIKEFQNYLYTDIMEQTK